MKSFLELANDRPRLSKSDLRAINNEGLYRDRRVLKKAGLQGMERLENWGIP